MEPPYQIPAVRKTHAATRMRLCAGMTSMAAYLLVSCATSPVQKTVDAAAPDIVMPASVLAIAGPDPGKDELQVHIQNAINALQSGQEAGAKIELGAVLRQNPENKIARSLLAQIQTEPAKYFGAQDSFNYTLQPGDTLSSIAQRFLDEPLKFHILAKFNGISDPSRLAPGHTIRIPGKKSSSGPSLMPPGNDSRRVNSLREEDESRVQRGRRFYEAGKYQQAIQVLENGGAGNAETRDLLMLAYGKYAEELAQNKNLIDAQSVLENALAVQPGNDKLRKQLKQVQKQREVMRLYKAGNESMIAGESDKALDAFNAVLKLDPAHEDARKQIAAITSDRAESMHKEAMVEYGKQNLDKAIGLWDQVLTLLPEHASAKLYRARAIDLKSRLQKLEQKPALDSD